MDGDIAQLVEHLLCMQGALGSIPSISIFFFLFIDLAVSKILVVCIISIVHKLLII